ncbi:hypothetical protein IQ259_15575 [Fortiea sp. LEGE XX443]|uniref:hypothetical protein n=1 Tax=Fortiea sp. LEGE XX443 TaxID=1828611 RepID=UPI001880CAD2|nr:hypothetical protein [Fortiea sp. LEGE XX443]MBE9006442.1 hypothetical protein [Fortiea sp. LEGE XX443]
MKNFILTIVLIISPFSIMSCSNSSTAITETSTDNVEQVKSEATQNNTKETPTNNVEQVKSEATQNNTKETVSKNSTRPTPIKNSSTSENNQKPNSKQPTIGTVKELVNGDLLCYATLTDEKGTEHNVGASFEICAESEKFLNKKVRASYTIASVNDCQSIEPCGKSKKESIITKMEVLDETSSKQSPSSKSQILSNGEWTITIGNADSWSGVNGTGNLTYKGCDAKGSCLELTGGKITCRDGKCTTGWRNGDYSYILEQPITEEDNPQEIASSTIFTVRKDANVILSAKGFKLASGN